MNTTATKRGRRRGKLLFICAVLLKMKIFLIERQQLRASQETRSGRLVVEHILQALSGLKKHLKTFQKERGKTQICSVYPQNTCLRDEVLAPPW